MTEKKKVWVGIHDHADSAPRWVDTRTSYTWLRAFQMQKDIRTIAYLREPHYTYDVEEPVNNLYYRFRVDGIASWVGDIVRENPDLILYNVCWYADGALAVQALKEALPNAVHVIRIHHNVRYLAAQSGFREFLLACDVAIAPSPAQIADVKQLGFVGPVHALPFGVNLEAMYAGARPFAERDIDIGSASNYHPARNLQIVEAVYQTLRERGRNVINFRELSPSDLGKSLGRTRVFWQTSLTEASGSRILAEALAAGCFPVVFEECSSTKEFINLHNTGITINSNIKYDFSTKKTYPPENVVEDLVDKLEEILEKVDAPGFYGAPRVLSSYDERVEISQLSNILNSVDCHQSTPRFIKRQTLALPVDEGGYVFNPTSVATSAGNLCLYRHVGPDGKRTLRRCTLNDSFEASAYAVWSEELNSSDKISWYADPRLFQVGQDFYATFNTGHSETPNNIYLVKVGEDGAPLSQPVKLIKSDGRQDIEKNWGFFGHDGRIFAIYSIAPFVVMEVEIDGDVARARTITSHDWDATGYESVYGELHGGASPIFDGDKGYLIAQSNARGPDGVIYRGTLLTFELAPPFRPCAVSLLPIFTLAVDECQLMPEKKLNSNVALVLYPTGAVFQNDRKTVAITYGVNDYRCAVRIYEMDELRRYLEPVRYTKMEREISVAALEASEELHIFTSNLSASGSTGYQSENWDSPIARPRSQAMSNIPEDRSHDDIQPKRVEVQSYEKSLEEINSHNWYHSYEIIPGVVSPGIDPTDAAKIFDERHHIPQDLRGMKALDLGALDGPYSFELEKRGAQVTSIDIQSPDVTGYNIAHRARNSGARYIQGNVYELVSLLGDEKFDIILYYGVWNHLKHPILAIEQIASVLSDNGIVCFEGECILNYMESISTRSMVPNAAEAELIANSEVPYSLFYSKEYKGDKWSWYVPNAACVNEWFSCAAMQITQHGFWSDHPNQRIFGNAKKIPDGRISVDNPVW